MTGEQRKPLKDNAAPVHKPKGAKIGGVAPSGSVGERHLQPRPSVPSMGMGGAARAQTAPAQRPQQPRPAFKPKVGPDQRGHLGKQFTPEANRPAQQRPQAPTPIGSQKPTAEQALRGTSHGNGAPAKVDKSKLHTKPGPVKPRIMGQAKPTTISPPKSKGMDV